MLEARLLRLEGIKFPCLFLTQAGELPEELVVNFAGTDHAHVAKKGPTTYRLEPSSTAEPEPLYRELFDE